MKYRIGELAKILGVSEHTLRYYEKEGLVVPERGSNNIRNYTEENKLWAEFILHMKETGMSLGDLKRHTKSWELGDEVISELLETTSDPDMKAGLEDFYKVAIDADRIAITIAFAIEQPSD